MTAIAQWLTRNGLTAYIELFEQEQIDLDALPHLSAADLKSLGIPTGPRVKLLAAAKRLPDSLPFLNLSETDAPGPSEREAERRQLTILFCDLVGSTKLSQQLDPERLRTLMQDYQQTCRAVIEKYEGHVAQYLGDGLMVYFGWPHAHEDDAERAIRTALELIATVKHVRASAPLQVRIGIATGPVVVGATGDGDASVPKLAVGETPNLAARLQSLAAADQIVVAPATRRLLGAVCDFADLGAHQLKGIDAPVQVSAVLGLARSQGRFDAARAVSELTPMVGRDEEIAMLASRWRRAKSAEGQVVLLSGEAGIGKSRLVKALSGQIAADAHWPLQAQCSPFHTSSALHPIIELIERAADFARDDSPEAKLDKLEAWLRSAATGQEKKALVAKLLSLPTDRYAPLALSPQQQKDRLMAALVEQIAALAREQPVLLLLEDAHWADPSTKELLDILIRAIESLSVMVVITFRPVFSAPWVGQPQVTLLTLARLSRKEAAALIERVTAHKQLPLEILSQILEKTDGVPLFVEELTKTVLESGLMEESERGYALRDARPTIAIPSTLHDSLMARLDKLAAVKEIAQIGACIGRQFPYDLVETVAGVPVPRLQAALAELVKAELVFERGSPPNALYTFKHALIKDAAYASLLRPRRELLHSKIAAALEQRFPEQVASVPELLAHHLSEAGLLEQAVPGWEAAADIARQRSAYGETINHLNRALIDLRKQPETQQRDVQEAILLGKLGTTQLEAQAYGTTEQQTTFDRLAELCGRLEGRPEIASATMTLWWYCLLGAQYRSCRGLIASLERLVHPPGAEALHSHLRLLIARLNVAFFTGDLDAAKDTAEAMNAICATTARPASIPLTEWAHIAAQAPDFLAWTLLHMGFGESAAKERARGIALTREGASAFTHVSWMTHELAEFPWRRTPEPAAALAQRIIALADEHGLLFRKAEATMLWGWAQAELGDPAQGLTTFESGFALLERIGLRIATAYWMTLLGTIYQRAGRWEEALAAVDHGLSFVNETGERVGEAELLRIRGEVYLYGDKPDARRAEQLLWSAIELARMQNAKLYEIRSCVALARLYRDQGKREAGYTLLRACYDHFTEGFESKDLREAHELLQQLRS